MSDPRITITESQCRVLVLLAESDTYQFEVKDDHELRTLRSLLERKYLEKANGSWALTELGKHAAALASQAYEDKRRFDAKYR